MNEIIIKNKFAITVKRINNNTYGCPQFEYSIYTIFGSDTTTFNCINYLVFSKKLYKGKYSKTKDVFIFTSYDIRKDINNIFTSIENIFNN